ncbi:hypothetical protein LHGZ1_0437 [Laribacter hongkongensis]|uniref:Uncharacterized protein n=1 Tax=Laribacter hongkongensis TaxID=168471 RepID=A0A248LEP7_9NEIS|nr:hypothetical protein LHGZ1_0437 [Laribacter hongkongensis]
MVCAGLSARWRQSGDCRLPDGHGTAGAVTGDCPAEKLDPVAGFPVGHELAGRHGDLADPAADGTGDLAGEPALAVPLPGRCRGLKRHKAAWVPARACSLPAGRPEPPAPCNSCAAASRRAGSGQPPV